MNKFKLFYIKEDATAFLNSELGIIKKDFEKGIIAAEEYTWLKFKNEYMLKCVEGFEPGNEHFLRVTEEEKANKSRVLAELYRGLAAYYEACFTNNEDVDYEGQVEIKKFIIDCIENS